MPAIPLAITNQGDGPPVVILHGLFGRRRNWQGLQKRLATKARTITVDMRNHGDSGWDDVMTYDAMADDVAALIQNLQIAPALVIGHSMGGKAAMSLALSTPEAVKALMVIDIAPVPYDHDYAPYVDAMRHVPLTKLERRSQADDYLADAINDRAVRAFLLQNLGQNDNGLYWQVNLDAIESGLPDILDFPIGAGDPYDGPTTFIAGGNSDYIEDAHHPVIEALFPSATFASIEGAGHWVHADKPTEVIAAMETFITDNQ